MKHIEVKNINEIQNLLSQKIMFLDGGMGTMLQKLNLSDKDFRGNIFANIPQSLIGNYDLLTITAPQIIQSIHRAYLAAGSDIIGTCSFNSNRISQSEYGTEKYVYKLNYRSAKIAKEICSEFSATAKPRFVAGSIGPSSQSLTIAGKSNNPNKGNYNFDDFVASYSEQALGLCEGGADIILIETTYDILNCKAAINGTNKCFETLGYALPIYISATIDINGRLQSGQTLEEFYHSIADMPNIYAIGLNCSFGAAQMKKFAKELSDISEYPTMFYPNAGLPNQLGEYEESPEEMARVISEYAKLGMLNIVGGCCGTTPEHIRLFIACTQNSSPRKLKLPSRI